MAARGEPSENSQALEIQRPDNVLSLRHTSLPFTTSYRGNWMDMPINFLEVVANVCYQFPKPRFIDPAVVYDTVKIHRLVEEASRLANVTSYDITLLKLASISGDIRDSLIRHGSESARRPNNKLSSERKFHMKEQAIHKLARALRLNEATCSIALSLHRLDLKGLTQSVMARIPDDPDVNYVHLFLRKTIHPKTGLDDALQVLDKIISANPGRPEVWRTKGVINMMKKDFKAAAHDFTSALSVFRYDTCEHSVVVISNTPKEQPRSRVKLADHEQPSSLLGQLRFLRGWAYLCAACEQVNVAMGLNGKGELDKENSMAGACSEGESQQNDAGERNSDASRRVKVLAKRSLSDIMRFLSGLDYSPDLAVTTVQEFSERTERCDYGIKRTRHTERSIASQPCTTFKVSKLFSPQPPTGLPPFPAPKVETETTTGPDPDPDRPPETHCEIVTAHPMLTEALHQLLLCHCLLQTSTTELTRHAHMVARLTKIIDGSPIFGRNEAPSRMDWAQLTIRLCNWIDLPDHWDALCQPEPLEACYKSPEMIMYQNRMKAWLAAREATVNVHTAGRSEMQESAAAGPSDSTHEESSEDIKSRAFTGRARSIMYWITKAPKVGATRPKKKKLRGKLNTAEIDGGVSLV